ncbi:MAG: serine--tRNA ligase [Candidatus ainarchaeum sp.]|nr:serine--tRNA ligase [Candidatus ainarchaeum sp.]
MLDARFVRENYDQVIDNLKKRHDDKIIQRLDEWKEKDEKWRKLKVEIEELKKQRNEITEKIKIAKANNQDIIKLMEEAKTIPAKIKDSEPIVLELERNCKEILMRIPNIMHESVPFGKDDTENLEIKKWGDVKHTPELRHHAEIAVALDIADFERAVKIAGTGFFYLKGDLAMLDLALQRLALDMLIEKGFVPVQVPHMMTTKAYSGVTDLAEFDNVQYKIEGDELRLISTSEHPLAAMYMDEIFEEKDLDNPIKYTGMSACFRREIGKHGIDERGLFRVHQFNKIEQVVFCKPQDSWKIHEELSRNQQEFMEKLEIPYRIVNVCTGDLGIVAAKKYDLEGWSPREGKYIELGSCSNCTSYQAVRLNIKYRKADGTKEYLHTLNNTMIPTSRTLRIIIEQYQTKDGTILIPKALQKYMNNKTEIKLKK